MHFTPYLPLYEKSKFNKHYGKRRSMCKLPHIYNSLPKIVVIEINDKKHLQTKNVLKRFYMKDQYQRKDA